MRHSPLSRAKSINQPRWIPVVLVVVGLFASGLSAQTYRDSFIHLGVGATKGLGYDADGNMYTVGAPAGLFLNATVFPGPDHGEIVDLPEWGFIVTKHAPDNTLVWARGISKDSALATTGDELQVDGMAVTPQGDLFVAGTFMGTVDFDPDASQALRQAEDLFGNATHNGFVLKLDSGGSFQWVRTWRGQTKARAVAVAPNGNVHVCGEFKSFQMDFDPGSGTEIVSNPHTVNHAAWLVTLDGNGDFLWGHACTVNTSTTPGVIERAGFAGLAVDSAGNVHVAGQFVGNVGAVAELVIVTEGSPEPSFVGAGTENILLISYDAGGVRRWLRHYGASSAGNRGTAVAVDDEDDVYLTGTFSGVAVDFNPPAGVFLNSEFGGSPQREPFVLKLDADGEFRWVRRFASHAAGSSSDANQRVVADDSGVYVGGRFTNDLDFDPGPDEAILDSSTGGAFLVKLGKAGEYLWSLNHGGSDIPALVRGPGSRLAMGGKGHGTFDLDPGQNNVFYDSPSNSIPVAYVLQLNQGDLAEEPTFTSTPSLAVTVGESYTYEIAVTGDPDPEIQVDTLPSWLTFNGSAIGGTPGVSNIGPHSVVISATNSAGQAVQSFTIEVQGVAAQFTSAPVASATAGLPYEYIAAATGVPAPTLSAGDLPGWLTFDAAAGRLSGTPPHSALGAVANVTITAENGWGEPAVQSFGISVVSAIGGASGGGAGCSTGFGGGYGLLLLLLLSLNVGTRRSTRWFKEITG